MSRPHHWLQFCFSKEIIFCRLTSKDGSSSQSSSVLLLLLCWVRIPLLLCWNRGSVCSPHAENPGSNLGQRSLKEASGSVKLIEQSFKVIKGIISGVAKTQLNLVV